jgi:hypothetical protein
LDITDGTGMMSSLPQLPFFSNASVTLPFPSNSFFLEFFSSAPQQDSSEYSQLQIQLMGLERPSIVRNFRQGMSFPENGTTQEILTEYKTEDKVLVPRLNYCRLLVFYFLAGQIEYDRIFIDREDRQNCHNHYYILSSVEQLELYFSTEYYNARE